MHAGYIDCTLFAVSIVYDLTIQGQRKHFIYHKYVVRQLRNICLRHTIDGTQQVLSNKIAEYFTVQARLN